MPQNIHKSIWVQILLRWLKVFAAVSIAVVLALAFLLAIFREDLNSWASQIIKNELGRLISARISFSGINLSLLHGAGFNIDNLRIEFENSDANFSVSNAILTFSIADLIQGNYAVSKIAIRSARAEIAQAKPDKFTGKDNKSDLAGADRAASVLSGGQGEKFQNLSLILQKIEIDDLDLVLKESVFPKVQIRDFQSSASFSNGVLELGSPRINLIVNEASLYFQSLSLSLDLRKGIVADLYDAQMQTAAGIINFSGRVSSELFFSNFRVDSAGLKLNELSSLASFFKLSAPDIKGGEVSVSLSVDSPDRDSYRVKGDLEFKKIILPDSRNSIQLISFSQAEYSRQKQNHNFKVPFRISGLYLEDRKDSYSLDKSQGIFTYKIKESGDRSLDAEFMVRQFGFKDELTEIKNVSAFVRDIKGVFKRTGEINFDLRLEGESIELLNPSVAIRKVDKVSAPMNIMISRDGAYSISALVNAYGGQLLVAQRVMNRVAGSVAIKLSGRRKEFDIKSLSAEAVARTVTASGSFIISAADYAFRNFNFAVNKGQINLQAAISRDNTRKFRADLSVQNLGLTDVIDLASGESRDIMDGTIGKLQADINGSLLNPLESLSGNGKLELISTRIKGFNFGEAVSRAISAIPLAAIKISPANLSDQDTSKMAQSTFSLADRVFDLKEVVIYRPKYTVIGNGKLNFALELDMKASLIFMQETFKSLGGGFEQLGRILGRIGKVEIPVFIKGKIPDISVSPDLVSLARNNSGLSLLENIAGGTYEAGKSLTDFILMKPKPKR